MKNKCLCVGIIALFFGLIITPIFSIAYENSYSLPPPIHVDMLLEKAMCRRMSVREFNSQPVTEDELSTILWAAHGFSNGKHNVHKIAMICSVQIYVMKEDAVYKYDPLNHSLSLWKEGDFRDIGMYDDAPLKIGITWNITKCSKELMACIEIGEIGQNVYFVANALNLGTVTTTTEAEELVRIDLPSCEIPKVVMPIGHPKNPYNFTYEPISSELPTVKNSSISLYKAIHDRKEAIAWKDGITNQEQSQIIWASYGYSYFIDNLNNKRHRTLPSAGARYPFRVFLVNESGIYRYYPRTHSLRKIVDGDKRQEVATASQPFVASAPCIVIPVLDKIASKKYLWMWYYEAGAFAHNVFLEATAWNLSANVILPVDTEKILSILELDSDYVPFFVIPVGREEKVRDEIQPSIEITKPKEGYLYIFDKEIIPVGITTLIGSCTLTAEVNDNYAVQAVRFFVDGIAVNETYLSPYNCKIPSSIFPKKHVMEIRAYDYEENEAIVQMEYVKIL